MTQGSGRRGTPAGVGLVLLLALAGCAGGDDHAYEAPPMQPAPAARPAPTPPVQSGAPTLSRVKTEAQRRTGVIRRLERIFQESQP